MSDHPLSAGLPGDFSIPAVFLSPTCEIKKCGDEVCSKIDDSGYILVLLLETGYFGKFVPSKATEQP